LEAFSHIHPNPHTSCNQNTLAHSCTELLFPCFLPYDPAFFFSSLKRARKNKQHRPKSGFFFQVCDIQNLANFFNIFAILVEFTTGGKNSQKIPNMLVENTTKFVGEKKSLQVTCHNLVC
jgi:hypothetical protein